MAKILTRLRNEDGNAWYRFSDALREAHCGPSTWCETSPYTDATKVLEHAVTMKAGLFRRQPILLAETEEAANTLSFHIQHTPYIEAKWGVKATRIRESVRTGHYVLVEKTGMRDADEAAVRRIVHEFGGSPEEAYELLNYIEETVLGYIPISDPESASSIAQMVEDGATSEVTPKEARQMVAALKHYIRLRGKP
jgi:hypothetical protein